MIYLIVYFQPQWNTISTLKFVVNCVKIVDLLKKMNGRDFILCIFSIDFVIDCSLCIINPSWTVQITRIAGDFIDTQWTQWSATKRDRPQGPQNGDVLGGVGVAGS